MAQQDLFAEAQERVKLLSRRPSNDELLALYGLYKQATEGDATGKRPGLLDPKGRAKHDMGGPSRHAVAVAAARRRVGHEEARPPRAVRRRPGRALTCAQTGN